jgi:hypothetical protein
MPWVRVPESYDAPPGERIRLIYRVEVPPYLPPQSKEWLAQQVATQVWPQVQTAHPDFRAESYEIVEVEPGRVYHVVFYGTSGGLGIGAILVLILAIIVAAIVLVSVTGYWAEKFIPPEVRETLVNLLPFMLMFGMLILIVAATR